MGYGKLHDTLFSSSIIEEPLHVRWVFACLIADADSQGIVRGNPRALSRRYNVTLEELRDAFEVLEAPDPESRTPDHEGRRLLSVEASVGERFTWLLVNKAKYGERRLKDAEDPSRRAYNARQKASRRAVVRDESAVVRDESAVVRGCPRPSALDQMQMQIPPPIAPPPSPFADNSRTPRTEEEVCVCVFGGDSPAEQALSDLNAVGGKSYTARRKDGSRSTSLVAIQRRMAEGMTLEDCRLLHRHRAEAWRDVRHSNGPAMNNFRPSTLYGEKHEEYIAEALAWGAKLAQAESKHRDVRAEREREAAESAQTAAKLRELDAVIANRPAAQRAAVLEAAEGRVRAAGVTERDPWFAGAVESEVRGAWLEIMKQEGPCARP